MTVSVLIVDDQALVREGLRMIIDAEEDLEVVGEAGDGLEALDAVRTQKPDVVLMDVQYPAWTGCWRHAGSSRSSARRRRSSS